MIRNLLRMTLALVFVVGLAAQADDFFTEADKAAKTPEAASHVVAVTNAETGEKTYYEATKEQYEANQEANELPEGEERDAAIAKAMNAVKKNKPLPSKSVAEGDCDESTGACYYSYYYYPTYYYYPPTIVVYRPYYYYRPTYTYYRPRTRYYSYTYTRTTTITYTYRTTYSYSWYTYG